MILFTLSQDKQAIPESNIISAVQSRVKFPLLLFSSPSCSYMTD